MIDAETSALNNLTLEELVLLGKTDGTPPDGSGIFSVKAGLVVRVTMSFKDLNILNQFPGLLISDKNQTIAPLMDKNILNPLGYKVEFLYIVMKNDDTLSNEELIKSLYQQIFNNVLSNFMTNRIVLESIQIQQIFPELQKSSFYQSSFAAPGRLPATEFETSMHPFCVVLMSSYLPPVGRGKKRALALHKRCVDYFPKFQFIAQ